MLLRIWSRAAFIEPGGNVVQVLYRVATDSRTELLRNGRRSDGVDGIVSEELPACIAPIGIVNILLTDC